MSKLERLRQPRVYRHVQPDAVGWDQSARKRPKLTIRALSFGGAAGRLRVRAISL
jgi:hypothetical protein